MTDPLYGKIWNMVADASLFSSSFVPDRENRVYEERENGYKLTVSGTAKDKNYLWQYEAYYDGKPYPVIGRSDVDAITIYKLSDTFTVGFFTKTIGAGPNFVPGGPYARRPSADGKTLVVEAAGRNADGTPFYDVITYTS